MRTKRRPEFWATLILLEGLALFCVTFSERMDAFGYGIGFIFGSLALTFRILAIRERKFIRDARCVPAEILSVTPFRPRWRSRPTLAEVEFRYWPDGDEPREHRTTLDPRRLGRLDRGGPTTAFLATASANRVSLELELAYHQMRRDESQ